jgi:hypothetical protein
VLRHYLIITEKHASAHVSTDATAQLLTLATSGSIILFADAGARKFFNALPIITMMLTPAHANVSQPLAFLDINKMLVLAYAQRSAQLKNVLPTKSGITNHANVFVK